MKYIDFSRYQWVFKISPDRPWSVKDKLLTNHEAEMEFRYYFDYMKLEDYNKLQEK